MPAHSAHLKIKIAVTVRGSISKLSHEKIGDCEQSRGLQEGLFVSEAHIKRSPYITLSERMPHFV